MNRTTRLAAALFLTAGLAACTKSVELKMAVTVVSEPEKADVSFKGKSVGQTPKDVDVKTFDDLQSILVAKPDLDVVERRIRILSPQKAQVIVKLAKGGGQSAVAKTLGLNRVLIFDYTEKVAFDSEKADLKPDALPVLNTQAEILKTYFPNATVHVCGYTDATGGEDFNLKLSLKRAQAVSDYLIAQGVGKDRLKTHGFGKDYPADTNATREGRALNRRTEVILPQ